MDGPLVERVESIIEHVQFMPGFVIEVRAGHGGVFMQGRYPEPDTYTGVVEEQLTRKWLVSPHMTTSEIVQTAFKLWLTSCEHRAREAFRYRGARVFGPHFDVEDLVLLCRDRENAGGRKVDDDVAHFVKTAKALDQKPAWWLRFRAGESPDD